jgi:hypothetical protein
VLGATDGTWLEVAALGTLEGTCEALGLPVGKLLGTVEGFELGAYEGAIVGLSLGRGDGPEEGCSEGSLVGEGDGAVEGC